MTSFLREEFDLDPALAYMNWGTHSIAPLRVLDAVQKYQREYETNPTEGYIASYDQLWKVQQELAGVFRAEPQDLFLRANVTEVMNAFILGIPLEPDAEILAADLEYGAVLNQCRYRAEADRLAFRQFATPSGPHVQDVRAVVDAVVSELGPKTRLLVLSHIVSGTGIVLPIVEIARETRKRGILLAVDGAHAPGTLNLDFSVFGDVDFYGGNLHKWFLGPKGTAFGWLNRRHHEVLRPLAAGWTTFERKPPFQNFGGGNAFQGRIAMMGCRDFAPFFAIHDTLSFWREHEPARMRQELFAVHDDLRARVLQATGLPCLSPPTGPLRGPLMTFALPDDTDGTALYARLLHDYRVQVLILSLRGKPALRLAPHFSTSESELERTIEALKATLG
jgi:isopenicillin-N epimerase